MRQDFCEQETGGRCAKIDRFYYLVSETAVSTYGYNTAGQMRTTTYSDGTPNVAMTYNAQGQVATLSDGTGTRTLTYDNRRQAARRVIHGRRACGWAAFRVERGSVCIKH